MEKLSVENVVKNEYGDIVKALQEKRPDIVGVQVDVSVEEGNVVLAIGANKLYLTPEMAVDLMRELRRAVVKVKPKALRGKK